MLYICIYAHTYIYIYVGVCTQHIYIYMVDRGWFHRGLFRLWLTQVLSWMWWTPFPWILTWRRHMVWGFILSLFSWSTNASWQDWQGLAFFVKFKMIGPFFDRTWLAFPWIRWCLPFAQLMRRTTFELGLGVAIPLVRFFWQDEVAISMEPETPTLSTAGQDKDNWDLKWFFWNIILAGQDGHSHGTWDTIPFHSWRGQGGKSEMTMLNDDKDMCYMDLLTFCLAGQDGHSHGTRDTTPFHSWRGQGGKSEMTWNDNVWWWQKSIPYGPS